MAEKLLCDSDSSTFWPNQETFGDKEAKYIFVDFIDWVSAALTMFENSLPVERYSIPSLLRRVSLWPRSSCFSSTLCLKSTFRWLNTRASITVRISNVQDEGDKTPNFFVFCSLITKPWIKFELSMKTNKSSLTTESIVIALVFTFVYRSKKKSSSCVKLKVFQFEATHEHVRAVVTFCWKTPASRFITAGSLHEKFQYFSVFLSSCSWRRQKTCPCHTLEIFFPLFFLSNTVSVS